MLVLPPHPPQLPEQHPLPSVQDPPQVPPQVPVVPEQAGAGQAGVQGLHPVEGVRLVRRFGVGGHPGAGEGRCLVDRWPQGLQAVQHLVGLRVLPLGPLELGLEQTTWGQEAQ